MPAGNVQPTVEQEHIADPLGIAAPGPGYPHFANEPGKMHLPFLLESCG